MPETRLEGGWLKVPAHITGNEPVEVNVDEAGWAPAFVEGGEALIRYAAGMPGAHRVAVRSAGRLLGSWAFRT